MSAQPYFGQLSLDESPDALIASSPDGCILYWSKGAEALFGFTSVEAEAVGRTVGDLIVPPDRIAKKVLADQQLSLASRIADDIDQNVALNLEAPVAASRMISAEKVGDVAALERILSERSTLRLLFNDLSSSPLPAATWWTCLPWAAGDSTYRLRKISGSRWQRASPTRTSITPPRARRVGGKHEQPRPACHFQLQPAGERSLGACRSAAGR
jgi:PAS domain-containing protein